MDGVVVKEEPLDLDDQVEGGLYPEAEEQGNLRSKRVWAIEIIRKTQIHILPNAALGSRNLGQAISNIIVYRHEIKCERLRESRLLALFGRFEVASSRNLANIFLFMSV